MRCRFVRRQGFTLVETIVALVLFQIGMTGLAATAGVAARDFAEASARRRAAQIARNRTETLRATACRTAGSGTAVLPGGTTEHWHVDVIGTARSFSDSVAFRLPRGRRASAVARGWSVCG